MSKPVKTDQTIEQKIAKLRQLTAWFESEDFELEQALKKFDEAKKLADEIEHNLNELKNTINIVRQKFDQ